MQMIDKTISMLLAENPTHGRVLHSLGVDFEVHYDRSLAEVCKIFKCSRRSLMRWVQKYKKDGKITGYERTPKAYKVHKEHVEFLLQEIKKNKTHSKGKIQKHN